MYSVAQQTIPNYFQLDQLPYLKHQDIALQQYITNHQMLQIRNFTHRHSKILSKILAYYPTTTTTQPKLSLFNQLPILSLQSYTFFLNDLLKQNTISQKQWNGMITQIQLFKGKIFGIVNAELRSENSLQIQNWRNIGYGVYCCVEDVMKGQGIRVRMRIKGEIKGLQFDVAVGNQKQGKNGSGDDIEDKFQIQNQAVVAKLLQKLSQKLSILQKRSINPSTLETLLQKMHKFYTHSLHKTDQSLLQLKLSHNYPLLRIKHFLPLKFIDPFTHKPLTQPIISNKNKNCMYGHLLGYNASSAEQVQNTVCVQCGVLNKEMQENWLLMFLRENLYNFDRGYQGGVNQVLYCPEFNRWKMVSKWEESRGMQEEGQQGREKQMGNGEEQSVRKQIKQLRIQDQGQSQQKKQQSSMQIQQSSTQMKNQQPCQSPQPKTLIHYTSYMHLCQTLKNLYTLTKKRSTYYPQKQIQVIPYTFTITNTHTHTHTNANGNGSSGYYVPFCQYSQVYELSDPCRSRYCNHLEFCDLRLFYVNRKKVTTFCYDQFVYVCPICQVQAKDTDLIYLKQTLIFQKYIKNKLLQPPSSTLQPSLQPLQRPAHKIHPCSIKLLINNIQKRIFIEYEIQHQNRLQKQYKQLQKLYTTFIDPYVPFSQYSLGISGSKGKNKYIDALYNFGEGRNLEGEKFQKIWYGDGGGGGFTV